MRILFVRHGEPDYEKDCLTGLGRLQAQAAARRLKDEGIREIFSSPQGRAWQTAQTTADVLGLPVRTLGFLHEITWGGMDGASLPGNGNPWDLVRMLADQGVELSDPAAWSRHPYFAGNRVLDAVRAVEEGIDGWMQAHGYRKEPGGYRCIDPQYADATVAMFCHGGSSSAALSHLCHLTFAFWCASFPLPFSGFTIVRFSDQPGQLTPAWLEVIGDGKHLKDVSGEMSPDARPFFGM